MKIKQAQLSKVAIAAFNEELEKMAKVFGRQVPADVSWDSSYLSPKDRRDSYRHYVTKKSEEAKTGVGKATASGAAIGAGTGALAGLPVGLDSAVNHRRLWRIGKNGPKPKIGKRLAIPMAVGAGILGAAGAGLGRMAGKADSKYIDKAKRARKDKKFFDRELRREVAEGQMWREEEKELRKDNRNSNLADAIRSR